MASHNSQTNFANYIQLLSVLGNINGPKIMGNSASLHYDITCVHMHMHRHTFVAQFFLTQKGAILTDVNLKSLHRPESIC